MKQTVFAIVSVVAVPWDAFIGAFLYYALLTLAVLGGADLSSSLMAALYLAVPVGYGALLAARMARAIGKIGAPEPATLNFILH